MRSLPSMRPARVREGSLSTDRQRRHRTSKSYPKVSQLTVTHKYGNMQGMKTTLEIPDSIFRRAKSVAAERGIPLREFVTEAVQEKLDAERKPLKKPWMAA